MSNEEDYKKLLNETIIRGDLDQKEFEKLFLPIAQSLVERRPKTLFRYRTCNENNFDALSKDKLFFSTPQNFNDPHDCFSYVDSEKIMKELNLFTSENLTQELIRARNSAYLIKNLFSPNILSVNEQFYNYIKAISNEEFDNWLERVKNPVFIQKIRDTFQNQIEITHAVHLKLSREFTYVSCLSEEIRSTLMWAHYADYHKGFALEYEVKDILSVANRCIYCNDKCNSQHTLGLYPIVYSGERFDATDFEIELLKYEVSKQSGVKANFWTPDHLFQIKTNSFKGSEWEYEKEWRLIYSCKFEHPDRKFEIIKPKAIYMGSKISDINKEIVKKLIEGKEIDIYEMYIFDNSKEYALSYK